MLPPDTRSLVLMRDLANGATGHRASETVGGMVALRTSRDSGAVATAVDPTHAARLSGVDEVTTASTLEESGRVEYVGNKLRILVRAGDSPLRQRFTIAHELGHVLLGFDPAGRRRSDEEERRCNRFAAALLMPAREFRNNFGALGDLTVARRVEQLSKQF